MSSSRVSRPAAGASLPPDGVDDSMAIQAIRLRHPWRMVFAVVLLALLALFVIDAAQRPAYDWPTVGQYLFDRRISQAAWITIQLTVYSMIIAIILGVTLAVMRLSPNPVV